MRQRAVRTAAFSRAVRRTALALLVVAGLLPDTPAWACSCINAGAPCQSLWLASDSPPVVFEGTVEAIEVNESDGGLWHRVSFRDVKTWLGESVTAVTTASNEAGCGYEFVVGQRYVVHSRGRNPAGHWSTGYCTLTRPVEEANELLAYLETLSRPGPGAFIAGTASLRSDSPVLARAPAPLAGVRITVSGPENRTVMTGPDGRFRIDGLPTGHYQISSDNPERPELPGNPRVFPSAITLANAHACAEVDVMYRFSGIAAVRLRDDPGDSEVPAARAMAEAPLTIGVSTCTTLSPWFYW